MTFALLFSGQGTQHPQMLPWLVDDALVRSACTRLGVQDWRGALSDPAWARANANAQIILTATAIAAWRQVAQRLPRPRVIAGYSVGELAAFSAAGAFDGPTALELASARAASMDRCAADSPGLLLSVVGIDAPLIERMARDDALFVAIRNGPRHFVLGGPLTAVVAAERKLVEIGGRCTRLKVDVASHTPLMARAAEEFSCATAMASVKAPALHLLSDATSERVASAEDARRALSSQIATTVRWEECVEAMHDLGVRCVIEIGPGQALSRLWNDRWPDIPARSADDFRTSRSLIEWISNRASP